MAGSTLACGLCWGQAADDSKPASSNLMGYEYPRVHSDNRVTFRIKAPDAQNQLHVCLQLGDPALVRAEPVSEGPAPERIAADAIGSRVKLVSRALSPARRHP